MQYTRSKIKAEAKERQQSTQFGGGGNIATTKGKSRDKLGEMAGVVPMQEEYKEQTGQIVHSATEAPMPEGYKGSGNWRNSPLTTSCHAFT